MAKKTTKKSTGKGEFIETNAPMNKKKLVPSKNEDVSVDSFSLADMPVFSLKQQTSHLANNTHRTEWTQIVNGRERKFYIEVSYGNVAPNADTETYLQTLVKVAKDEKKWKNVPVSNYKTSKLKGVSSKGSKVAEVNNRHLQALYGLNIKTNFVYDRENKKYKKCETRIISGITYKSDELGEKKVVTRETHEGQFQTYETDELESVTFAPEFVENFLMDLIPFDFDAYINIKNPTPKKLYKITNKFVNSSKKEFGLDLIHFCKTRLGMQSEYLEDVTKTSKIASKLRPDVKRVNEFFTDGDPVSILKDKKQPSGYRIVFNSPQNDQQQQLFNYIDSLTTKEKGVFIALKKEGVWSNVAQATVFKYSKMLGGEGNEYLLFCIKKFKNYESKHKISVPASKRAAVLMGSIKQDWYFSDFKEWYSDKSKKEEKEELKRYGGTLNICDKKENKERKEVVVKLKNLGVFNIDSFKKEHPKTYNFIYTRIKKCHEKMSKEHNLTVDFWTAYKSSILNISQKCFKEFQSGNKDYVPDLSAYE